MRDRIIGALDTGCRRGEMMKIQNKHVDWQHRRIRILKEHSKGEVARVIPFEQKGRLEKLLRRRAFLGADAFVFGNATTGEYVGSFRSAWETLLLVANGVEPTRPGRSKRWSNREELARVDLHWHDLRHEALSRLADDGVPGHELQMLAGHANITTTQLHECSGELVGGIDAAGASAPCRPSRASIRRQRAGGLKNAFEALPIVSHLSAK